MVNISGAGMARSGDIRGIRDFQLRILSGMRGNEAVVEQALRRLGADQAEMAASRDRTGQCLFLPDGHFRNAVALLGVPQWSETIEPPASGTGYGQLTKLTWQLPLWPDLVFYVQGIPRWPLPHDLGFARPSHEPPAIPSGWEDLRPWAWLREEVLERFGPPTGQGANWFPCEEFRFQIHNAEGKPRRFWATFSWNLLQRIEWV